MLTPLRAAVIAFAGLSMPSFCASAPDPEPEAVDPLSPEAAPTTPVDTETLEPVGPAPEGG